MLRHPHLPVDTPVLWGMGRKREGGEYEEQHIGHPSSCPHCPLAPPQPWAESGDTSKNK
jgi:hypothetical protein